MPKLKVNGQEVEFENGMTVLQACELAGAEIPRFCYHERLKIAGNCRMCLVEMEKSPKPIASCAMPAGEGMVIKTDTQLVKKAREGVMEFLLINHPLDCPICDQGGECDLQDQAMTYGRGKNRFHDNKRAVKDKYMGPLIKTHMTRCIHCTRCIRFITDVAGVPELGATGRGEHMEVGTYVEKALTSEVSGNIVDICPVGALTSKPYAYKARSWELKKTESIDVLDAVGSNIRVDSRGLEVMRILPRLNEDINEEWISDKTRHACDGLKYQRLDQPMVRVNNKLTRTNWETALAEVKKHLLSLRSSEIGVITGKMVDAESLFMIKMLADDLQIKNIDALSGMSFDHKNRMSYLFNTTISGIEKSDLCLFIGANPRYEASMVGLRLRKRYLKGNFKVAAIGAVNDQTYPVNHLGDKLQIIEELISEKHAFSSELKAAKNPIIIVGEEIFQREDSLAIQNKICELANHYKVVREDWNGYNVLHKSAANVAALELGVLPQNGGMNVHQMIDTAKKGEIKLLYVIDEDEVDLTNIPNSCVVVYQGHHGDKNAHRADVILPGAAYTEKNASYINLEGRFQRTRRAITAPNIAKEDWEIVNDIVKILGRKKEIANLTELRNKMAEQNSIFKNIDVISKAEIKKFGVAGNINYELKIDAICDNFYMTDSISRASKTMAECAKMFKIKKDEEAA